MFHRARKKAIRANGTFVALGRPVHPTRVIGQRSATSFHAKRIEIALNIR